MRKPILTDLLLQSVLYAMKKNEKHGKTGREKDGSSGKIEEAVN